MKTTAPSGSSPPPTNADPSTPAIRAQARDLLLTQAVDHDARALRQLGKRVLSIIAPEIADAHDAAWLARQEALAHRDASLSLFDDGHGKCHGKFTVPSSVGEHLKAHLLALAAPARHHDEEDDTFTDPTTGGTISAGQARMLACEAGIIPLVLDGASQPLDVGRKQRFHTPYQRIAIAERDRTCTATGCDMPPSMCAVHHDHPWAHGEHTHVHQGRLLCWAHHHRIHDPAYKTTIHPNNQVSFHRRT